MTDDTRNPTDSGNIAGSGDYEVGYKKPPKDTRFGGPRAPRRGTKPKSFDALRKLMQEQAGEIALDAGGNPITDKNGRPRTNAEMFVEAWMKDRKQRKSFAEFAWGKPPESLKLEGEINQKVVFEVVRKTVSNLTSLPASEADPISGQPGEAESDRSR